MLRRARAPPTTLQMIPNGKTTGIEKAVLRSLHRSALERSSTFISSSNLSFQDKQLDKTTAKNRLNVSLRIQVMHRIDRVRIRSGNKTAKKGQFRTQQCRINLHKPQLAKTNFRANVCSGLTTSSITSATRVLCGAACAPSTKLVDSLSWLKLATTRSPSVSCCFDQPTVSLCGNATWCTGSTINVGRGAAASNRAGECEMAPFGLNRLLPGLLEGESAPDNTVIVLSAAFSLSSTPVSNSCCSSLHSTITIGGGA